ncbi:MAG: Sua5 family C-terminal domain-containing protein, partial [Nitratireductor sp.]
ADLDTIAIRAPDGPSRTVITGFGKPLAAPSANRSGRISPTTAAHASGEFADRDLLILDAGPARVGLESTIARVDGNRIILLRPGGVGADQLAAISGLPVEQAQANGRIEAPGMLDSHYAPEAGVVLDVTRCPQAAALLAFGPDDGNGKDRSGASEMRNLSPKADLAQAAANLYSMLKDLDSGNPTLIAVEPIPREGLGAAINDRLRRAAAPRGQENMAR